MAVIKDACNCGEAITVLTGSDALAKRSRQDGKQAFYPDKPPTTGYNYNIFRCRGCDEPASETVQSFSYE